MPKNKRLLENGNIAIKKCRYGLFAYNINDKIIGRSLEEYGEWTQPEMNALGSIIQPGDIVLDIGAYIGTHAVFFAQKVAPNGLVYAIEPQRFSFNLLCTNVALNNLLNVICLNKFATDTTKKIKVPLLDPDIEQNFGGLHIEELNQGEPVDTLIIDSLKLPRLRLIKIDVEDGEEKVLEGAKNTIKRCKPVLYVENNTVEGSDKIISQILKLDYRAFWHILDYFQPTNFFGNKINIFKNLQPEANMICFPKEANINLQGFVEVTGVHDNWQKGLARMGQLTGSLK